MIKNILQMFVLLLWPDLQYHTSKIAVVSDYHHGCVDIGCTDVETRAAVIPRFYSST